MGGKSILRKYAFARFAFSPGRQETKTRNCHTRPPHTSLISWNRTNSRSSQAERGGRKLRVSKVNRLLKFAGSSSGHFAPLRGHGSQRIAPFSPIALPSPFALFPKKFITKLRSSPIKKSALRMNGKKLHTFRVA